MHQAQEEAEESWEKERLRIMRLAEDTEQNAASTVSTLREKITSLEGEVTSLKEEISKKQQRVDELSTIQITRLQEVVIENLVKK